MEQIRGDFADGSKNLRHYWRYGRRRLETARTLGKDGWTLALVARNAQKGERIATELRAECGNEDITFKQADLSLQKDVRRVAHDLADSYPRIDVLHEQRWRHILEAEANGRRV